jgi:hypothetical protein
MEHYSMKPYWGVDIYIHIFLTSALVGVDWSASRPDRCTSWKATAGTHWMECWVGTRIGLNDVEKRIFLTLPGLELQLLGRPTCTQSQYLLRYMQNCTFSGRPKFGGGGDLVNYVLFMKPQNHKIWKLLVYASVIPLFSRSCSGNCEESCVKFANSLWWIHLQHKRQQFLYKRTCSNTSNVE